MASLILKTKENGEAVFVWELLKKLGIEVVAVGFDDHHLSFFDGDLELLEKYEQSAASGRKVCKTSCGIKKRRAVIEGFNSENRK